MKTSLPMMSFLTLLVASQTTVKAEEDSLQGQQGADLFKFHGCVNCHGADGKSPVSKMVPELAGKPAGELYSKATKILSGEGESDEAKLMHAAFYSPSSCDAPPTDAQIKSITAWLAAQ
ncbi:c-type cytochrome [Halochromatium glycolicum]|nr:c-type cytochrome [Halochromatium glycolicum]